MGKLSALEKHGKAVLAYTPEPLKRGARTIVRIFYTSEGGELLACDSGLLTRQAAWAMIGHLRANSRAVRVEEYGIGEPRPGFGPSEEAKARPLFGGARLVKLPSLHPDTKMVSSGEEKPLPSLSLVEIKALVTAEEAAMASAEYMEEERMAA